MRTEQRSCRHITSGQTRIHHTRHRKTKASFMKRFCTASAAVLLIILCSFGFGSFFSKAHDSFAHDPMNIKYYKSIQIKAGDSIWSIAETYMDENYDSVYAYMDELVSLNNIDTTELDHLQEGDYLTVTYYDSAH